MEKMMSGVHEGLAKVMAGLSHIPKERSRGVSYEFRSIDAVFAAIHGLMADNGMWFKPRVLDDWNVELIPGNPDKDGNPRQQTRALFRLEVLACHEDGSETSIGVGLCQSHDYGDKAVYQAQQNGMKYVVIESFAIPTAGADMDARHPDPVPAEQITERLQNRLKTKAAQLTEGDVNAARELYEKFLPENLTPENVETTEQAMEAYTKEAA